MLSFLRIRQARRAAYAALEPFVHKTSTDGREPQAGDWLQPQILGFLATAVTVIALRTSGGLRSHALASVQSQVLNALTGIGPELIGEEICLLSSRQDPAFADGSVGAIAFLDMLVRNAPAAADLAADPAGRGAEPGSGLRRTLDELWEEHVGAFIRRTQAAR